jgi:hypothetical protein
MEHKVITRLSGRLAREIMRAACDPTPGARIIREALLPAAQILAERGYITVTNLDNGWHQVERTSLARALGSNSLRRWRRYPTLNPNDLLRRRKPLSTLARP